jgi:predicted DNA-binding transcriptional regulator YafY
MNTVEFELIDKRNALERILLHFAHFKKQAERIDTDRYRVTISYDKDDENEMVIRILSFGPMIRVTAPQHFVGLIKERLINQKSCEH